MTTKLTWQEYQRIKDINKCNHCKKEFKPGEENWELTNKETQQVVNTCLPCQNKHTFAKKKWEQLLCFYLKIVYEWTITQDKIRQLKEQLRERERERERESRTVCRRVLVVDFILTGADL